MDDNSFLDPTLSIVHDYFTSAYDNLILSDGSILTASNVRIDIDSEAEPALPVLLISSGSFEQSEWEQFEVWYKWTIPAKLKVKSVDGSSAQESARHAVDDINLQTAKIRGLPIDEDRKLHVYDKETTGELFQQGKLQYLIDTGGGPYIKSVSFVDDPQSPFSIVNINFFIEVIVDCNPDLPYPTVKGVFLGTQGVLPGATASFNAQNTVAITEQVDAPILPSALCLSPSVFAMHVGNTLNLVAYLRFQDQSTSDVSASAQYSSADPTAVTVNSSGLVSAVGVGSTTISAVFNGLTAIAQVTVSL